MGLCAFVTGGSGFLGSFVVRDLLESGFERVVLLVRGNDALEAMVVADGKPFTTALLWLEDDGASYDYSALDATVLKVNVELSHPEQVKRWVVAAAPLSVARGELTPNLKVRRNIVAETRAALISDLYDNWEQAPLGEAADTLHRGEMR